MHPALLIFVGGGLGALTRYGATVLSARWLGTQFPWGTLLVNFTGCFLIGLIIGFSERSDVLTPAARIFLIVGFLGGLTTFSTYALETINAARAGDIFTLTLNILAQNGVGLMLVALGMLASRLR
ncbi:MAG TPA: fluoride efflux transporter CrcB [Kiritimatiellia bacterium]|nr:fluoride efflux transporter CrcB [Kiritimatiellia bacterium]HMO97702.1 fluoride efflux transporter CrcB [Kiritimatiellia bacterium]HMP95562.1 fluoride efflux transporter CrcB [Kiritimatiellia bacterium]